MSTLVLAVGKEYGQRALTLRRLLYYLRYSRWPYIARVWVERANRRHIGHTRYSEIATIYQVVAIRS